MTNARKEIKNIVLLYLEFLHLRHTARSLDLQKTLDIVPEDRKRRHFTKEKQWSGFNTPRRGGGAASAKVPILSQFVRFVPPGPMSGQLTRQTNESGGGGPPPPPPPPQTGNDAKTMSDARKWFKL